LSGTKKRPPIANKHISSENVSNLLQNEKPLYEEDVNKNNRPRSNYKNQSTNIFKPNQEENRPKKKTFNIPKSTDPVTLGIQENDFSNVTGQRKKKVNKNSNENDKIFNNEDDNKGIDNKYNRHASFDARKNKSQIIF